MGFAWKRAGQGPSQPFIASFIFLLFLQEKVPEAYLMNIGKNIFLFVKGILKNKKKCVKGKEFRGSRISQDAIKNNKQKQ